MSKPEQPIDLETAYSSEPARPAPELRATAFHVGITLAIAALVGVIGGLISGGPATGLTLTAPGIVFLGAAIAGYRAWKSNREGGRWQVWQGGMWLLLMVFIAWAMIAITAVAA